MENNKQLPVEFLAIAISSVCNKHKVFCEGNYSRIALEISNRFGVKCTEDDLWRFSEGKHDVNKEELELMYKHMGLW